LVSNVWRNWSSVHLLDSTWVQMPALQMTTSSSPRSLVMLETALSMAGVSPAGTLYDWGVVAKEARR
jgi:hypothetical protein